MAAIGNIVGIKGQAFVVDAKGNKHVLKLGEVIQPGDVIQTAAGSTVYMHLTNGRIIEVTPEQSVKLTNDLAANAIPAFDENAVGQTTVQAILQAINDGKDISQVIDDTAAGLTGGDSSDAHSALFLDRISEATTGNTFNADGAANGSVGATQTPFYNRNFTSALSLTAQLDPNSDTGVLGDGITNKPTPSIIGTGVAGDKISVTMPGTGEVLTTTVGPNNTWTVTPTTPLADGTKGVAQVVETDLLGNSSTANVALTIDRSAPPVTAQLDPTTDSGVKGDGITNNTKPNIIGTGEVGDTVKVTMPGTGEVLTTTVGNDGTWKVTPTTALPDGTTGQAQVVETDPAGNSTTANVALTIEASGPAINIKLDAGIAGDGIVNKAESTAAAIPVTGTVSGVFKVGDTVTLTVNGKDFSGAVAAGGVFSINVPGADLAANPNHTVDASVSTTDAAGNTSTAHDAQSYTVNLQGPAIGISLDANIAGDGIVNIAESQSPGIPVTGTVTGAFHVNDTVTLTVNGKQFTGLVEAGGKFSIDVPGADLAANPSKAVEAQVTTTDAAGNTSTATDTQDYRLSIDPPNATIALDANFAGDGIINIAESKSTGIPVTGTVGGDVKVGDPVVVTVDGVAHNTTVITLASGALGFSVNVSGADLVNDPTHTIDAKVTTTDSAGNSISNITSLGYGVDLVPPSPTIALDANFTPNHDGIVNIAESTSPSIPVTGTVGGDAKLGDSVVVTVNGVAHNTQVITLPSGNLGFSVGIPGADLVADAHHTINAVITSTDSAGNTGSVTTSLIYGVDTVAPPLSAQLDPTTDSGVVGDGLTNNPKPNIIGTGEVGDSIKVTMPGTGEVLTTTVGTDGTWKVTPTIPLADGTTGVAQVVETDPAGNTTPASVPLTIDTTATIAPTVTILTDTNHDGYLSASELTTGSTPVVSENFNNVTTAFDFTAHLTNGAPPAGWFTSNANGKIEVDVGSRYTGNSADTGKVVEIEQSAGDASNLYTTVNTVKGQVYLLTFEYSSRAGFNTGTDSAVNVLWGDASNPVGGGNVVQTVNNNTAGFQTVTVEVVGDGNPMRLEFASLDHDGTGGVLNNIQLTPLGSTAAVEVGIPAGAVVGDTLTVTDNSGIGSGTQSFVLTQAEITAGKLDTTVPVPAEGKDLVVNATITDLAGNVSQPGTASAIVDTTAPTLLTAQLDPTTDSGVKGDGITNNTKPNIIGTGEVGDTVKVTMPGTGEVLTTTVGNDGTWKVTPTTALPDGTTGQAQVVETDPAGNSTTANVALTIEASGPAINIKLDAGIAGDGIVNKAESTAAAIPVTGTVSGVFKVGDTVTLTVNGKDFSGAVAAGGVFSINVPGADLAANPNHTVDASVSTTDAAGNTSTAHDAQSYTVNLQGPAIGISLDANIAGDGIVNIAESQSPGIPVTGTVTGAFHVNDTVTLTVNGKQFTGLVEAGGKFSIDVPGADLAANPSKAVEAQVTTTDAAGNTSTATDTQDYRLSIDPPNATIALDANFAGDGIINIAESKSTGIPVTGTVGGDVKVGDPVVVTVDGVAHNTTVITLASGALGFSVNVSGADLVNDPTHTIDAKVTTTDSAGNSISNITSLGYGVDLVPPSPTIALDANFTPNHDGIVNIAESTSPSIPVTGTVGGDAKLGDSVVVTVNGVAHNTQVITLPSGNLGFSVGIPGADLVADAHHTINAVITSTDSAGNTGSVTTSLIYGVDTVAPPLSAQLDPTTDSGVVGDGLTNNPKPNIIGTGEVGDSIKVTMPGTGEVLTTTVGTDGTWKVTPTIPLADGTTGVAQVVETDPAGNTTPASVPLTIDTSAPTILTAQLDPNSDSGVKGDGITNNTKPNIIGTGEVGDTVKVTMPGTGEVLTTTVGNDGTWKVTPTTALPDGTTGQAQVVETDPAGNSTTATVALAIDTTAPDAPVVGFSSGLAGNYYGVNDSLISTNSQPLNEVLKEIASNSPTATFIANALSFNPGYSSFYNALGIDGNLATFLGGNATNLTLSNSYHSTNQAVITLNGVFTMAAGTYTFRVTGDDGYQIIVDGKPLGTDNANHPANTTDYSVTLSADAGNLHTIQIVYWDQGGIATFGVSVAAAGSSNFAALNVNPSNTLTATVTLDAADQADVSNGGSVHVTSSNGIDTTLHLNSGGVLVDGNGTAYVYQNGVIYVPTNAATTDGVTITATVSDVAGNVSNPGSAHTIQAIAPDAPVVGFQPSGLVSSYYGINDSLISSNSQPLNEVLKEIASNSPTATFVANALSFNPGDNLITNNLGTAGNLATFLGGNAANLALSHSYGTTTQAVISLNGSFTMAAGTYTFRVTADDGYQIIVDGKPLVTDNSNHPVQTTNYSVTLGADAGNLHTIQIVYWDQGGAATFGVSVAAAGSSNFAALNVNPSNTLTATVALDAADQTDVTNGGSVHVTSSNGLDTTLHLNSSGVLVDASGHAYQYQQGVIYVPTGASANTVLTVSSSVNDVHGNSSSVATTILGTGANDVLTADSGNDVIIGGAGNDTMNAGLGADVFKWSFGDAGKPGAAAVDVINGFKTADGTQGGDVLDLRDLLVGENSNNLQNYLHFEQSGSNTIVHISSTGAFSGSNTVGAPTSAITGAEDQKIVLAGVNLVGSNTTDVQVINALLTQHKLVTDH